MEVHWTPEILQISFIIVTNLEVLIFVQLLHHHFQLSKEKHLYHLVISSNGVLRTFLASVIQQVIPGIDFLAYHSQNPAAFFTDSSSRIFNQKDNS